MERENEEGEARSRCGAVRIFAFHGRPRAVFGRLGVSVGLFLAPARAVPECSTVSPRL